MSTVLLSNEQQFEVLKQLFDQRIKLVMDKLDDDDSDTELDLDQIRELVTSVGSLDGFTVQPIPVQEPTEKQTGGSKKVKKTKTTKKKKDTHDEDGTKGPKRPTSSFIFFRKEQKEQLALQVKDIQSKQRNSEFNDGELFFQIETIDKKTGQPKECDSNAKIVSKIWANMTDEEKLPFETMAQNDKERYIREKGELSNSDDSS